MKLEDFMTDVTQRMDALGEQISEARLAVIVSAELQKIIDGQDDAFGRKIRFGGGGDPYLMGTKFSRYNYELADIEFLHDVMTGRQRAGLGSGPSEELTKAFNTMSSALYVSEDEIRKIDRRALDDLWPRIPKDQFRSKRAEQAAYARAMDSLESGFGQQLIGAQYVRDLWEGARPESRVFNLLDSFEMSDPTAFIPVEVDIPEMIWVSESTANNSSAYPTVKTGSNRVQVDAKKFIIHQMWSGELEEDSIIPWVPFLRRQAQLSIAHYSDSLVLNGDTTNSSTGNINLDDADPADTKHYLDLDGMRHSAIVDNTNNFMDLGGSAITFNDLRDVRAKMVDSARLMDWAHPTNPDDLVYIADPETADRIATLDEVIKVKQLVQNANLLGGEVGRIIGHPVISSMAQPKTEADGKVSNTPGNNTLGQITVINRRGYKVGWRRRVKVEVERIPSTDQTRIVYSLRLGLGRYTPTGAASGIEHTAVMANISLV